MNKLLVRLMALRPWDEEGEKSPVDRELDEVEQKLEGLGTVSTTFPEEEEFNQQKKPETSEEEKPETEEEEESETEETVEEQEEVEHEEATEEQGEKSEPEKKEPSVSDDQVFEALIKAKSGGYDVDNDKIEKQAVGIINNMSPKQLLQIVDKAQQNVYGDDSVDILNEAKSALAIASTRQQLAKEENEKKSAEQQKFNEKVGQSLEKTAKKFPALTDSDSDFSKFMITWREENIAKIDSKGKVISKGPLFSLLQNPNWPELVAKYAHDSFLSSSADGMKEELEKRRQKETDDVTSLASDTTSSDEASKGSKTDLDSEADEIEKKLASMGTMQ